VEQSLGVRVPSPANRWYIGSYIDKLGQIGVDSNLETVGVTPLRKDVLPSAELAGNAAPIVGA
jgi:hypothetical protein